jgi:RNA recognition motif-containing protein
MRARALVGKIGTLLSFISEYQSYKESRVNIYVGNLSRDVTESDLREAFQAFGEIQTCNIIKDKFTGESRGFGFVEMPNKEEADKALAGMNGKDLKGRNLTVNEARPRTDRPRTGGGFGGGRGGSRGGFGGGGRRY